VPQIVAATAPTGLQQKAVFAAMTRAEAYWKELCGAVTVVAPRLRRLRGGVCGEGVCGEGGHVPVEKVCKSLHMFKSLHMALVGHITRTRGPLPNKNCQLPSTALKLLPKRTPGTHPANLI